MDEGQEMVKESDYIMLSKVTLIAPKAFLDEVYLLRSQDNASLTSHFHFPVNT